MFICRHLRTFSFSVTSRLVTVSRRARVTTYIKALNVSSRPCSVKVCSAAVAIERTFRNFRPDDDEFSLASEICPVSKVEVKQSRRVDEQVYLIYQFASQLCSRQT